MWSLQQGTQMKNARRSRRVPSSDLLDVRQSTNSQKCSTTLLMQSMMHALPLAYITDIPSHITCATPACVHASPDRQKQEATRLSPGAKERLIVKISYLMSFTRLLSRKPRTMLPILLFLPNLLIRTPVCNGVASRCVSSLGQSCKPSLKNFVS